MNYCQNWPTLRISHCEKYRNFTWSPGVEILWKGTVSTVSGESPEITVFFTVSTNGLKSRSALTLISLISVFSKPCAYVALVDVPWCCTRNWHSKKVSCYKCRGKIYWFFWIREWKLFFKSFYKLFVFTSCLFLQVVCFYKLIAMLY